MNVKENTDDFQIEFAAPGFSKKDFEVTIEDNVLNVSEKKAPIRKKKKRTIHGKSLVIMPLKGL
ncbi:Hsp20/alpha crystallin family protein [Lacinutrix neustonica]|uniref:Hsp20/alpha crystallin family protein n=1 Tax=Lacinutrix neustonica TaxID=2980107 RepID=A0A9E8MZP5_9FLAO|nr:Hsp20/alpha crystallin family protein [Lacinutrix neustonica]